MKTLACKSVMREVDELERAQQPGLAVREHLSQCGSCRSFADDRLKLSQLVGELEVVTAPADFDFRLRARLATERSNPSSVAPRIFGFGLPSVALAIVALMVGIGFFARSQMNSVNPAVARDETPRVEQTAPLQDSADSPKPSPVESPEVVNGDKSKDVATTQAGSNLKGSRSRPSNRATVRRDELITGSETVAMFPLEAAEPLSVSVDYAKGGSRTISLPAVSFGSQQVVSRNAAMIQTSARTVW